MTQDVDAPVVAIVDGDTFCYSSFRSRMLSPQEMADLAENGQLSAACQEAHLLEALQNFLSKIDQLKERTYADYCLVAVKHELSVNYRDEIYVDYKLKRRKVPGHSNNLVPQLRKLLCDMGVAVPAVGREADDLIRIWHTQALQAGHVPIVCAEDKDLLMIDGQHFRLHKMAKGYGRSTQEEFRFVTPEEGRQLYYAQLLMGDPTDNIPGIPRMGPKTAVAVLAECETEEDFQKEVIYQYMAAYAKDWRAYLLANGKMIHLQKHPNDWFSVVGWAHPGGGLVV